MRLAAVLLLAACGTAAGGGRAATGADQHHGAPLNPVHEGRPVILGYDSHHPDCFIVHPDGGETEVVSCPDEVLSLLEGCRGGELYRAKDGEGCVCVPIADEPHTRTECPGAHVE
jgi:hypothetical protein